MNKYKWIWWAVSFLTVFILFSVVWSKFFPKPLPKIINNPESLLGIQTNIDPWIPEVSHLRERLTTIGLPALKTEGSVFHIHQHLDIFIEGKLIPIPSGIGINQTEGFISDIHVHDGDGIIHIESPKTQDFTLGQFFDIWGVEFTSQNIGGYKNKDDKILKVFVNGNLYKENPRQLVLKAHQEIVITYGNDKKLPNPIPSTYKFSVDY